MYVIQNRNPENIPVVPLQSPETESRRPLMEKIRDKIDGAKSWIKEHVNPLTSPELEQQTGEALTYVAERTIADAGAYEMRGPGDSERITEAVGAAAEQTVAGGLVGRSNPIETLERDGFDQELVDATVEIAAEDPETAEAIAKEIDRVEGVLRTPEHAAREVYKAKIKRLKETTTSSIESFTSANLDSLSKQERKSLLDNPESWDSERRKLHESVFEEAILKAHALSERLKEKNPKPTIYALRGNTASGKTRALSAGHEMFAGILDGRGEPSGAINPDSYKFALREGDPDISAAQVHDEGSMISRRIERQLTDPDMSVVLDKRNETPGDIEDILANASETERNVRILDVDVPLESSLVGVLMREKGGEDPNVPFDAIIKGFVGIRANRSELIKQVETGSNTAVDGYMLMAFDPDERRPVVVAVLIDGKVVVDQKRQELYARLFSTPEQAEADAEVLGNTVIDDAFIQQHCNSSYDNSEKGREHAAKVAARLGGFKGKTLRRAVDIMAGAGTAQELKGYLADANHNLLATSRTANGTIDTSASSTKAASMESIDGDEAAARAKANFDKAISLAFEQRDADFSSASKVRQLVESIAAQINDGIVKEGSLIRTGEDSDKYPYTRLDELPAAMEQFYEELHQKLTNPDSDPVEVAAFCEYHIDLVDHFFADGCGKTAKAISSFVLMRAGLSLPSYKGGRDEYYKHAPRSIVRVDQIADRAAWQDFLQYYKSMVKTDNGGI